VRFKFGEALVAILKLGFDENLIATSQRSYNLVAARVSEGAPLIRTNMVWCELNRLRSTRETAEGQAQIELLELRTLSAWIRTKPLRLRGRLNDVMLHCHRYTNSTELALSERPDLKLAKAAESFAEARIRTARSEGS